MAYLHGAYGEILASKTTSAKQTDAVLAYIGTAPVNLIRGYAEKELVNMPLKIQNMGEVQANLLATQPTGTASPSAKPSQNILTIPWKTWARSTS